MSFEMKKDWLQLQVFMDIGGRKSNQDVHGPIEKIIFQARNRLVPYIELSSLVFLLSS